MTRHQGNSVPQRSSADVRKQGIARRTPLDEPTCLASPGGSNSQGIVHGVLPHRTHMRKMPLGAINEYPRPDASSWLPQDIEAWVSYRKYFAAPAVSQALPQ